jgi:hypothetical protein
VGIDPVLSFVIEFDERTAWEVEQKGWFECARATVPNGTVIPLSFWDTTRLTQELTGRIEQGKSCFAEPALNIVPSVTRENMEKAVKNLRVRVPFSDLFVWRPENSEWVF